MNHNHDLAARSDHDLQAVENQEAVEPIPIDPIAASRRTAAPDRPMQLHPEWLIAKAIEQKLPVKSLEQLLAMRERLKAERAKEAFYEALTAFQVRCPVIPKTEVVKSKDGSIRYRYASLPKIIGTVSRLLGENGLSYSFDTLFEAHPSAQVVTCTIHHTLGHSQSSTFRAPIEKDMYMNEIQKSGSSLTYGKRYALCNALGIVADDDDDAVGASLPPADDRGKDAHNNGTKCITPAQHRLLEARIRQLGLDRERVKDWLKLASKGRVEHLNDLPAELFDRLLAKLEEWSAPAEGEREEIEQVLDVREREQDYFKGTGSG
jgi:hypothetical protein